MNPQEEALQLFNDCYNLLERYRASENAFHHRIVAKHFAIMVCSRILNEISVKQKYTREYWEEVNKILEEEFVWKPEKPKL